MRISDETYDRLVGQIYDCAANPNLWPDTLESVRLTIGSAYILVGLTDDSVTAKDGMPTFNYWNTPWEQQWLEVLVPRLKDIPRVDTLYEGEIDKVWLQLDHSTEEEFYKTDFYNHWAKPQGLYDTCNIVTMRRSKMIGMFSAPIFNDRPRYSPEEITLMARLAPHIRRSICIGDLVDKGKLSLSLYQSILDNLAVAVVLLGRGQRIVYANAAAELLFEEGSVVKNSAGQLHAARADSRKALTDSVTRAAKGDQTIGISGIGIPLSGSNDERAAAYILPIGKSEVRSEIGQGQTAVFITKRSEQQPAFVEILRTVFNLTQAEARLVHLLIHGLTPHEIAKALDVSIHTIRTHLSNSFAKTGTTDQGSLTALVNQILPPIKL